MSGLTKIPVRTGIPSLIVLAKAVVRLANAWDPIIKQVLSESAYNLFVALKEAASAFVNDVQPPVAGDPLP